MNRKEYFTTGEFAKLCHVKKQTLFHYDSMGIFSPEILGDNGYRYYSYRQFETFGVLQIMKDLRVPLKEIKAHMDSRSPEGLIDLLESRESDIDTMIDRLKASKKYITNKIELTREGMDAKLGQVLIQDLKDEYLIVTNYTGHSSEKAVEQASNEHFQYCHSLGIYSAYAIGAMIPVEDVTEDSFHYTKFYTSVDIKNLKKDQRALTVVDEGGPHLVYYDNHGYENVHSICLELKEYARAHGLTLGEYFYEDVILDDLSTNGYYNYLVKLSVRIESYLVESSS